MIPSLPRNASYGRSGCADNDPVCGIDGNPMGSGLPLFVENIPLRPASPSSSSSSSPPSSSPSGGGSGGGYASVPGQFWYGGAAHPVLYYHPRPTDLSSTSTATTSGTRSSSTTMAAEVVVPVAEGSLFAGEALADVTFQGIRFEHVAWNGPNQPAGFVDLQDGVHFGSSRNEVVQVPGGGVECTNCTAVAIKNCTFARMAGSAVSFSGTAKRCAVEDTVIADVGCSGVQIGNSDALDDWNVTALQSEGNSVLRSSISSVGQEFTGCVAVMASATNKSPSLSLPRPPPFQPTLV